MVKRQLFIAGASMAAAISASVVEAMSRERDHIEYGCSDLVVVGRLTEQGYQPVELENDILGHGWVTAEVSVDEVAFGQTRDRKLPVRYFAHTYMREDRDFVFVLRPAENGRHLVRSAQLIANDPQLATRCSE